MLAGAFFLLAQQLSAIAVWKKKALATAMKIIHLLSSCPLVVIESITFDETLCIPWIENGLMTSHL